MDLAAGPSRALFARLSALPDLLASPLRTSHYLELVNPLWTTHQLKARVVSLWDETASARTLPLRPGGKWRRPRAGQHVRVGVPVGGMHHTRTYSISSAPGRDDECITITVKAATGGRVSQHLVRNVVPGDYWPLGLRQGDFVLPDAVPLRPLFITAGSGITPVMSMLRDHAARGDLPSIVHLHYAPHPYDVIFAKELAKLRDDHRRYRLRLVYTRERGERSPAERHFTAAQLQEVCPDWRDRDVSARGPQGPLAPARAHWPGARLSRRPHLRRVPAPSAQLPRGGPR